MDCYGDERGLLTEYERFYNNSLLSDVTLVVGEEMYVVCAVRLNEIMLSCQFGVSVFPLTGLFW